MSDTASPTPAVAAARADLAVLAKPLSEFGSPDWARQKQDARDRLLGAVPDLLDQIDTLQARLDAVLSEHPRQEWPDGTGKCGECDVPYPCDTASAAGAK